MINKYSEYLKMTNSIDFEMMQSIHLEMISEIEGDLEALNLYDELIESATKYASYRAMWFCWDREKRMDQDGSRSSCHNSLIVKFNMLARYLTMQGKSAVWREKLGYEEDDKYNRKVIGDFACYLVFVNSLIAR